MTADPHSTPTKPAFQALDVEVPGDGDRGLGPPAPRTPGSPTKVGRTMWTRDEDGAGAGGIVGPGAAGGNGGGFNSSPMPPDAAASVITQVTAAPAYGSVARTSAQSFRRPSPVAAAPTKPARRDAGWLGKFFCCMRPPEERSTQLHPVTYTSAIPPHDPTPLAAAMHTGPAFIGPPAAAESHKPCLVLDLDETLVHSSFKPVPNADYVIPVEIDPGTLTDVYVLKRPYVDYFMEEMGKHYEIVVFTASLAKYADPLLDLLDVHNVIRWRLFRESCYPFQGNYVKDLTSLGRPLERTIILDNSPHSYAFQPQNALPISSFIDDPTDCDLLDAVPVLAELAEAADVAATLVANDGYLPRMRYAERGLPMPQNVEQWS